MVAWLLVSPKHHLPWHWHNGYWGKYWYYFADYIFRWIFLKENVWISIEISLKFIPKGSTNNIPALVEIMDWCRPGDKLLSQPMLVRLLTHICITRPQWVNKTHAASNLLFPGWWVHVRLWCLQCISTGDTTVLHWVIAMYSRFHVTRFKHHDTYLQQHVVTGVILGLRPANEKRRYKVTPSLIAWAQS